MKPVAIEKSVVVQKTRVRGSSFGPRTSAIDTAHAAGGELGPRGRPERPLKIDHRVSHSTPGTLASATTSASAVAGSRGRRSLGSAHLASVAANSKPAKNAPTT